MKETESDTSLKRPSVAAMDEILGHPFEVLDKGFLRVVDYMGDDAAIVQAARVSYGKGTKQVSQDRGLIRYLLRHRHTTPFEMCEIKLHLKMPIFVARQWMRHRTASINEYSARYSILPENFFTPTADELAEQSKSNAQGRGDDFDSLMEENKSLRMFKKVRAKELADEIAKSAKNSYSLYKNLLNERDTKREKGEFYSPRGDEPSIAREISRVVLPLSTYTEFYWKCDLHNYLHFVTLRADSHAQKEIRDYADVMVNILEKWVPITYQAWVDYAQEAVHFSREEHHVLKNLIQGKRARQGDTDLSDREWRELGVKFGVQSGKVYKIKQAGDKDVEDSEKK